MQDVLFVALVIGFFAIAAGAVWLCDRIVRGAAPAAETPVSVERAA
jgi:uncharacterized membrane protein